MSADSQHLGDKIMHIWEEANDLEPRIDDAIVLLADACAFGIAEGNFDPAPILERIKRVSAALHAANNLGARH
ncbi:hypothetical protein [Paracoccus laeviglucosivorans]|uniref:Uncharacterized protein n=1 Tax=Paracoccus laeviglucosivorans TaxID=1197861 RepID=A0A521CWY8_9RHOB|nr:hypothetical protein [Paracoccus laeviglucosivorans]SMO63938.1 hypothetical protein SAMN06265221_105229 [Paracoccus laeviglucosivorans]